MQSAILTTIPVDEFRAMVAETVREQLAHVRPEPPKEPKYHTRRETARKLRISLPTLNERTKNGEIEAQRIGARVLYSEEAIARALQSTKKGKGGVR